MRKYKYRIQEVEGRDIHGYIVQRRFVLSLFWYNAGNLYWLSGKKHAKLYDTLIGARHRVLEEMHPFELSKLVCKTVETF